MARENIVVFIDENIPVKEKRFYTSINNLKNDFGVYVNKKEMKAIIKKADGEIKELKIKRPRSIESTVFFETEFKKNKHIFVFYIENKNKVLTIEEDRPDLKHTEIKYPPFYVEYNERDNKKGSVLSFYYLINQSKKVFEIESDYIIEDIEKFQDYNNKSVKEFFDYLKDLKFFIIKDFPLDFVDKDLLNIWNGYEPKKVKEYIKGIDEIENIKQISGEEKERLQKYRVNQSIYRKNLINDRKLKTGKVKCDLCEIDIQELLIASHIKPWSKSNEYEQMFVNNGLLLCPIHDALFDKGLISFDDDGKIIVSEKIKQVRYKNLSIKTDMRLNFFNPESSKFFKWHRKNILK
ncbi:MAG: HNH endonuclease [Candidatus Absconditabacterales bacterium]|nr:HNH endonuclease [Candidatus Absconditabacterales bacterium]